MNHRYSLDPLLKYGIFLMLVVLYNTGINAQVRRTQSYENYIEKYNKTAVDHMQKYKIPASITLAQGLLESGAGLSELATKGNNHFGIKCHNDWSGASIHKSDDKPNECFRKYKKAEESYDDHAKFLTLRSRYLSLFDLQVTDYTGWARGLQKAGYATDKAYANKLIKLIEDYELYKYDGKKQGVVPMIKTYSHTPYKAHGLLYVVVETGDTYEALAKEFDFKTKDLYKYNEVPKGFPLGRGDIVYFQKKKKKADKPNYEHVVKIGESMHSISQRYGMQVKNLYKMNKKDFEYVPEEGDVLKLR